MVLKLMQTRRRSQPGLAEDYQWAARPFAAPGLEAFEHRTVGQGTRDELSRARRTLASLAELNRLAQNLHIIRRQYFGAPRFIGALFVAVAQLDLRPKNQRAYLAKKLGIQQVLSRHANRFAAKHIDGGRRDNKDAVERIFARIDHLNRARNAVPREALEDGCDIVLPGRKHPIDDDKQAPTRHKIDHPNEEGHPDNQARGLGHIFKDQPEKDDHPHASHEFLATL